MIDMSVATSRGDDNEVMQTGRMFDIDFLGNAVEERRNLVPNTAAAVGNDLDVRNLRGFQLRGHAGQGLMFRRGIRDVRVDSTRRRDPDYPQVKASPIVHED